MDYPAGSVERLPSVIVGEANPHARGSRLPERQPAAQLRRRMQILKNQGKQGRRAPKRGDVTKAIFKELKDIGMTFWCSSSRDADSLLRDLPFPTKTEATAIIWPKVDAPVSELCGSDEILF